MKILESFDPGSEVCVLILLVIVQVTTVIAAAAVVARMIMKRRAAERHQVWMWALAFTLLGPVFIGLSERAGLSVRVVAWTRTVAATPVVGAGGVVARPLERRADSGPIEELADVPRSQPLPFAEATDGSVTSDHATVTTVAGG